jgi:L-fuculose-phosphate aldolase
MSRRAELTLKQEIVKTMALLFQRERITPTGGNISARPHGSDHFWITPSGVFKGDLKIRDLVKVTIEGEVSSARFKPSVETPMHSGIYQTRDDVDAIIHAHNPVILGLALAGIEIKPVTPESAILVGEVPIVQFEPPGTEALADGMVEALKSHQVAVMQNHGVVAVGRTMLEALNRLEIVDLTARIMTVTHIWGRIPSLSATELEQLKRLPNA